MYFSFSTLDIVVVFIYLAIFASIIFFSSRKTKSNKDFKTGSSKFGAFAIMCTQGASMKGSGSLVNYAGKASAVGQGTLMAAQAPNVGGWLGVIFGLARRLKVTSEHVEISSLGDIYYHRYNKSNLNRIPSAGATIWLSLSFAAMQISAVAMVLHMAFYTSFGLTFNTAVIISAIITLLAMLFGGVNSVIWTDVYQWWVMTPTMFIILPIFAMLKGATPAAMNALDVTTFFTITPDPSWVNLLISGILSCTVDMVYLIRYIAAKDERSSTRGTALSFLYTNLWAGLAIWLGIAAFVVLPELPANDQVLYQFAATVLPSGLLGLFLAGLMATTVSTSDSYLHTAIVAYDTDIDPLINKTKVEDDPDGKKALRHDRIASVVLIIISIFFILASDSIYALLNFGMTVYASMEFAPVLCTLFWKKSTKEACFAGQVAGLASVVVCTMMGSSQTTMISTIVSGAVVILVSLIANKETELLPGFRKGDAQVIKGVGQDWWVAIGGIIGCVGGLVFSVGFSRWFNWVEMIIGALLFVAGIYIIGIGVPKKEAETAQK